MRLSEPVRLNGTVYTDAEALLAEASDREVAGLRKRGLLTGDGEEVVESAPEVETPEEEAEWPRKVGGSWYQLSDGRKVQGEANAQEEQAKL